MEIPADDIALSINAVSKINQTVRFLKAVL
jgi:hypothetical protein